MPTTSAKVPIILATLLTLTSPAFTAEMRTSEFDGVNTISIVGIIESGDFKEFRDLLIEYVESGDSVGFVFLASSGGDVIEAMKIGKLIRKARISTRAPTFWVWPDGSTSNQHTCLVVGIDKKISEDDCNCDSACFIIWAAGVYRYGNILGLHRPRFSKTYFSGLSSSAAKKKYEEMTEIVRNYLSEMNIPTPVIEKMFSYGSDTIHYLDSNTIKEMETVPFHDEWIKASCNPWTEEEEDYYSILSSKKRNRTLSYTEEEYFDFLMKKVRASISCYRSKLREIQSELISD